MMYNVYDVYYTVNGQPGIALMQGADILSALKLFSQAYPYRFITMVVYKFSFNS